MKGALIHARSITTLPKNMGNSCVNRISKKSKKLKKSEKSEQSEGQITKNGIQTTPPTNRNAPNYQEWQSVSDSGINPKNQKKTKNNQFSPRKQDKSCRIRRNGGQRASQAQAEQRTNHKKLKFRKIQKNRFSVNKVLQAASGHGRECWEARGGEFIP